jgi:hypothetical protein
MLGSIGKHEAFASNKGMNEWLLLYTKVDWRRITIRGKGIRNERLQAGGPGMVARVSKDRHSCVERKSIMPKTDSS